MKLLGVGFYSRVAFDAADCTTTRDPAHPSINKHRQQQSNENEVDELTDDVQSTNASRVIGFNETETKNGSVLDNHISVGMWNNFPLMSAS